MSSCRRLATGHSSSCHPFYLKVLLARQLIDQVMCLFLLFMVINSNYFVYCSAFLIHNICKKNLVQIFHIPDLWLEALEMKQPKLKVSRPPIQMPLVPRFLVMGKCMIKSPSVTKQEIANYWKQRRMVEEDHLSAAIKAAAWKRAQNLSVSF